VLRCSQTGPFRPASFMPISDCVEVQFCGLELLHQLEFPAFGRIQIRVDDAIKVRGNFNFSFAEQASSPSAEAANKVAEFENDILPRTQSMQRLPN